MATSRTADTSGGHALARRGDLRVLALLALLVAGALGMVGFLVWKSAIDDGAARLALEHRLVRQAIRDNGRSLARITAWTEASLVQGNSYHPAAVSAAVRHYLDQTDTIKTAFLIDSNNRLRFAKLDGVIGIQRLDATLAADVVQLTRAQALLLGTALPETSSFLRNGSSLIQGVAMRIRPKVPAGESSSAAPWYLVVGERLESSALRHLAAEYGIEDARWGAGAPAPGIPAIALMTPGGEQVGYVAWRPRAAARERLVKLMPGLAGALAIFAAFTALVGWRLRAGARALRLSTLRFRNFAEAASDQLFETDLEGRLTFLAGRGVNAAGQIGRSFEAVFGQPLPDAPGLAWSLGATFRDQLLVGTDQAGLPRTWRVSGQPLRDAKGRLTGCSGTASDVTAELATSARATFLARHDPLTELPNRTSFLERLAEILATPGEGAMTAVLCCDLDRFKDTNDSLGHEAGDLLLKQLAERFLGCVTSTDSLARLGGDEFAFLLSRVRVVGDIHAFTQRVQQCLEVPFDLGGQTVTIAASLGIAVAPFDGDQATRLLQSADIALYRAKADGRGVVRFFKPGMETALRERLQIERDLRQAIADEQLSVHYQPKVDVATDRVVGLEALARWQHPARGSVSPGLFIPVAEETGLILPLGEWVLNEACRQATRWPVPVAVNLSAIQFARQDVVAMVQRALAASGLPPSRLEIEVTESVLHADLDHAERTLDRLKELGVRIAMDDFGTGYSSLAHLHRFPFDRIKIDRSFIARIGESAQARSIIRAVLALGESLGMTICAEGVEHERERAFLVQERCDEGQGYYWSRPLPPEELTRWLEQAAAPALPATTGRRAA